MIEERGILRGDEFVSSDVLDARIQRAATALSTLGVEPGDTVALLLRNDHPYFEATFAAGLVGASPVPVNWHGTPEEILYVLEDSGAKVLVGHADLVAPIRGRLPPGVEVRVVATPQDIGEAYSIPKESWTVPDGMVEWLPWIESFEPWAEAPRAAPTAQPAQRP